MRIKHKILLRAYEDTALKDALFAPDDTLSEVIVDGYLRQTSGKFNVEVSTTYALPTGDIAAIRGVYLEVEAGCTISINGGAAITLSPNAEGAKAKVFMEAVITSLSVTAGAEDVVPGKFCFYGDVAA
jgi:hypothetical protein